MPSARPPLSRDRVVAEAMALADEQGLAALSMRALAGRLGVEAMSLYHHVAGKEALLDAMVDAVFGELHLPVVGGDWRAELRARSVSGRTVLLRHPWAVGLMDSRRTPGPQNLRHHDAVLGCLAAQGFSLVAAGTAFALLDAHLYGFMQQEVSLPFDGEADLAALGAELLGPEVRAAYPHFTAFAEGRALQPGYAFGDEFEVSLDLVLGALGTLPGRPPRRRAPAAAVAAAAIEVSVPVLGVDGCPGGWVGAVLVPGAPRPRVVVAPTIELLVETVRADLDVQVVGIDIPIGLPDGTIRQADVLARRALPGRAGSVFTTLTRSAYLAADRASADAVNRGLSGQGVGAQAFALEGQDPRGRRVAAHPADRRRRRGAPRGVVRDDDRCAAAREAHRRGSAGHGSTRWRRPASPARRCSSGSGYAADDVLDACAVAWSAHRRATGDARWLPDPPEVFSDGIRAAIVV